MLDTTVSADIDDIFLTPQQLADRWQLDPGSLANARSRGEGVPFVKLPSGAVRYRVADVLAAETDGYKSFTWKRLEAALETYAELTDTQRQKLLLHLKRQMRD